MARRVEGQVPYPGPSRDHTAAFDPYEQNGDRAFKSPHAVPAVNEKPVGIRDNMPSSNDTYSGIPGDGIVPG